jgi:hypothetical protein
LGGQTGDIGRMLVVPLWRLGRGKVHSGESAIGIRFGVAVELVGGSRAGAFGVEVELGVWVSSRPGAESRGSRPKVEARRAES